MAKQQHDLAKIFGVEGMITPKTLTNETKEDIRRKRPNDMALDVRALLDELNVRIVSEDIIGVQACLAAAALRIEVMSEIANALKKSIDNSKKK